MNIGWLNGPGKENDLLGLDILHDVVAVAVTHGGTSRARREKDNSKL